MQQDAFPGEDISDRPPPEESVPGLLALIEGELPSGVPRPREWSEPWRECARVRATGRAGGARAAGGARRPPRRRPPARLRRRAGDDRACALAELPRFLAAGDLVVVNTSATPSPRCPQPGRTAPSSSPASTPLPGLDDGVWIVEPAEATRPSPGGRVGERIALPGGASAEPVARYAGVRLLVARLELPAPLADYLAEHGRPIRYGYVPESWPLDAYQTVYALEPGSAEMPSAGRPFTAELITQLVARGVIVAPVTLHTGVSSPERHERPYPERHRVPASTARLVNAVHRWGGRVIATGTTVVRALETGAAGRHRRRR